MVAAMCSWHENHERAATAIAERWKLKQTMVVAAPALIESYSVLTRLPAPHRLAPADALTLLEANFVLSATLIALTAANYRSLLQQAPGAGVAGGRIYDGVIAACARKANVQVLLTFNEIHFLSFADDDLQIVVP